MVKKTKLFWINLRMDQVKKDLLLQLSKLKAWRDTVPCRREIESQRRIDCLLNQLSSLVERQQMLEAAKSNSVLSLAEFEEFFVTCAAACKHKSSSAD
jgi:hypothetical protein